MLNIFHLPNLVSPLKDGVFLMFLVLALYQKHSIKRVTNMVFILVCGGTFFVIYLLLGLFQGALMETIYYLRVYIYPLIFMMAMYLLRDEIKKSAIRLLHFVFQLNTLVILISIGLYVSFWLDRSFFHQLLGSEASYVWYIDKAYILRLGLPFAGPNIMGVYCAGISFLTIWLMRESKVESMKFLIFTFAITSLALFLTFSRSSILLLLVALIFYFADHLRKNIGFFLSSLITGMVFLVVIVIIINSITDDALTLWLLSNLQLNDSSIEGHVRTFPTFVRNIDDFFLFGYDNGTVGPKAYAVGNTFAEIKNSENSILVVLYDMGLFLGTFYFISFFLTMLFTNFHRIAKYLIIGLFINFQFLPNIYEYEAIMTLVLINMIIVSVYEIEKSRVLENG
ncbi:MAG: O-antigen ligase family protein [Cyclobacteriaceae bacterium]